MFANCCVIFALVLLSILVISNKLVAVSIIVKALNSSSCPFASHVHGPIRSTDTVSQGAIVTVFSAR